MIRRWISWFAIAGIFSIACWFLAQWQFARADEVSNNNRIVSKNYDLSPVPLDEVLKIDQTFSKEQEFIPVKISGQYTTKQVLVRNRPFDGNPGFLQLAQFKLANGNYFWVERGWLPTGSKHDYPDAIPSLDTKTRYLTVRLRKSEAPIDRTAPVGQVANINLQLLVTQATPSKTYTQAYGRLVDETNPVSRGVDLGRPELSEGNHFSYALQWLVFALMAIGAVIWNIGQDRRRIAGAAPRKLKALTSDKDAEVEDQLLGN